MSQPVSLSDQLCGEARIEAERFHRTLPGQIEHWAQIGRLVEANPDLPFGFIREVVESRLEAAGDTLTNYRFG